MRGWDSVGFEINAYAALACRTKLAASRCRPRRARRRDRGLSRDRRGRVGGARRQRPVRAAAAHGRSRPSGIRHAASRSIPEKVLAQGAVHARLSPASLSEHELAELVPARVRVGDGAASPTTPTSRRSARGPARASRCSRTRRSSSTIGGEAATRCSTTSAGSHDQDTLSDSVGGARALVHGGARRDGARDRSIAAPDLAAVPQQLPLRPQHEAADVLARLRVVAALTCGASRRRTSGSFWQMVRESEPHRPRLRAARARGADLRSIRALNPGQGRLRRERLGQLRVDLLQRRQPLPRARLRAAARPGGVGGVRRRQLACSRASHLKIDEASAASASCPAWSARTSTWCARSASARASSTPARAPTPAGMSLSTTPRPSCASRRSAIRLIPESGACGDCLHQAAGSTRAVPRLHRPCAV